MIERVRIAPRGPEFSRMVMGYWRLMEWQMAPQQLVGFIEQHLDLGVTTVDHADIYGDYQCEAAFGAALRLAPALRARMELVTARHRHHRQTGKRAWSLYYRWRAYHPQRGKFPAALRYRLSRSAADPPPRSADGCG